MSINRGIRGINGWELIKLIDYVDPHWSYEHIYRHTDGREAVVGPGGYCSDPDLGWLLYKQERSLKREARVNVALSIALNAPWLLVTVQAIVNSGWKALFTFAGYGICSFSAFGAWNALLLSTCHNGRAGRLNLLMVCCPLYLSGFLLISAGHSNMLQLATLQIPLLIASLTVGLLGSLKQMWRD